MTTALRQVAAVVKLSEAKRADFSGSLIRRFCDLLRYDRTDGVDWGEWILSLPHTQRHIRVLHRSPSNLVVGCISFQESAILHKSPQVSRAFFPKALC